LKNKYTRENHIKYTILHKTFIHRVFILYIKFLYTTMEKKKKISGKNTK